MPKIEMLAKVLFWPLTLPHEALHWVAARCLGVRAEMRWDRVLVEPPRRPRHVAVIVIALTPFLVGLSLFSASVAAWWHWAETIHQHLAWSAVTWLVFWWMAASYHDIRFVWVYLKTGQWPDIVEAENEKTNWH